MLNLSFFYWTKSVFNAYLPYSRTTWAMRCWCTVWLLSMEQTRNTWVMSNFCSRETPRWSSSPSKHRSDCHYRFSHVPFGTSSHMKPSNPLFADSIGKCTCWTSVLPLSLLWVTVTFHYRNLSCLTVTIQDDEAGCCLFTLLIEHFKACLYSLTRQVR